MKSKIKKFINSKLFIFIITALVFSTIGVSAATYFPSNEVTYDNTESGLESTDVQGAIDELYGVCITPATVGNTILENVDIVTSGDGLYEDEYEYGRYFYKGGNPNNYVTFNNEKAGWRIISVERDGTIKIIRSASIGEMAWDSSNSNNWARPASLNTYLNGTYYNELNSTAKNQIVAKDWSIGTIEYENYYIADQIIDENSKKWNGKVALATISEYIRSNSNKSSCGSFGLSADNYSSCRNTNWMYYLSDWWWSLSARTRYTGTVFVIDTNSFNIRSANSITSLVRPVVYLSSEVKITGGTGTQDDPYKIA